MTDRKTHRSEEERRKLLNRLKRVEGQVRGIERMVEEDAYCPDIMLQVSAVTSALNSFNRELMSAHLHHCVLSDVQEGREESLEELAAVLQKLMK